MKESKRLIFIDKDTDFRGIIEASQLVLEGSVIGDVNAPEKVHLKKGSSVLGDIYTKKIIVEEGALHKGKLKMMKSLEGKTGKVVSVSPADKVDNENFDNSPKTENEAQLAS